MTECISTPASCERRPTAAILGAGIAGLTAAQELAERGFVVTVYEPLPDERNGLGSEPAGTYPPVKLGGLAASQYSTVGPTGGSRAELRPFPNRRGQPRQPQRAVAGEHGFRFFPAYYLHTWDMFQRIPVYELTETASGTTCWAPTCRTVYDNVRRVITQGMSVAGKPSLVFPRELPRSPAEFLSIVGEIARLGFTPGDIATFESRLLRYLVTSPLRRALELENVSAYDFFVGHDANTNTNRFSYSPSFNALLSEMPRVLAAFDSRWGDARTNITTYLQLYLHMDRRDDKADGVLNGPTSEAWFDHWYRHLVALGVRFLCTAVTRLDPPAVDATQPPHLRPRVQITLADGTRVTPDYTIVAVDAPAAEGITGALRAAGTGGTVAGLNGFTTFAPPPEGPLQSATTRPQQRRNPYVMDQMGRVPWDRFQTLCGIQYYFDTEFQLLRGHMLYAGTEWALSSINQQGFWERQPILDRDAYVSVLSVDIGDFNTPSSHLGKAARACTPDEIAVEVWRQIVSALTGNDESLTEKAIPWPAWYALDRGLVMADGPGQGQGRIVRNETPYLIPIVGDWNNRPSSDPWNPHGSSWTSVPPEDWWLADLEQRNVWQARHGGYQVHNNSVVFAGTWNKTFTRMTSMEAACESGRHGVNAILDHYIWVASGGVDRRDKTTLNWEFPFDFLDQGLSSPIRFPTPAGDYCYVFDVENREPADTRALRTLDSDYCERSLPPPWDMPMPSSFGGPTPLIPPLAGGQQMYMPTPDYNQQLFAYLQSMRHLLDQWTSMTAAGYAFPTAPPGLPTAPPGGQFMAPAAPFMPPLMPQTPTPAAPPMPPASADYTQQLFSYLQAWRQYLEQMTAAGPGSPKSSAARGPAAQPPTAAQNRPASDATKTPSVPPAGVPVPPSNPNMSANSGSDPGSGSGWPPPLVSLPPGNVLSSQIRGPGIGSGSGHPGVSVNYGLPEPLVLKQPDNYFRSEFRAPESYPEGPAVSSGQAEGGAYTSEASAELSEASAFLSARERLDPGATPQSKPAKSLYSSFGAQAASARVEETGQKPSA